MVAGQGDGVMEILLEIAGWLAQDGRWSLTQPRGIPFRVVEHLWISTSALLIAAVIGVPPATALAHFRRAEALANAIVNVGRAIPSFGLIVVFWLGATRLPWLSTRFWPLVAALVALALPPIFTNTYTAIRNLDGSVIEAARGMGYTHGQMMIAIEVPLASPVIMAGIRLAYLQVVATTAIGAIVTNGGGLGRFVVDGFAVGRSGRGAVVAGALLLASLTIAIDRVMTVVERRLAPKALRGNASVALASLRTGAAG